LGLRRGWRVYLSPSVHLLSQRLVFGSAEGHKPRGRRRFLRGPADQQAAAARKFPQLA
jgi:hypothetical protein